VCAPAATLTAADGQLPRWPRPRRRPRCCHLNELWDEQLRDRVTLDNPSDLEAQAEGRSGNLGIGLPAGDQSNFAERGQGRDGGGEHVCAARGIEDEVDPSTGELAKLTCNVGAA
jgi:hypothetical protein